jgi:hypothetical protein
MDTAADFGVAGCKGYTGNGDFTDASDINRPDAGSPNGQYPDQRSGGGRTAALCRRPTFTASKHC